MTSVNAQQEALLDALLKDCTSPHDILGEHGLLKQLTKRLVERVLEAELTAHLGYAPYGRHSTEEPNVRNGKGQKTVQTDTAGPPWDWIPVAVVPRRCHEEWLGDVEETYWAWRQQGYPRWAIQLWLLGCVLQWLETRVRCAVYAALWGTRTS